NASTLALRSAGGGMSFYPFIQTLKGMVGLMMYKKTTTALIGIGLLGFVAVAWTLSEPTHGQTDHGKLQAPPQKAESSNFSGNGFQIPQTTGNSSSNETAANPSQD